jgi:plastocyanin
MRVAIRRTAALAMLVIAIAVFIPHPALAVVHTISISNFAFTPTKTVVQQGDTVKWKLAGGFHTTTADPTSPKFWDSGLLSVVGDSFMVAFTPLDAPGNYPYHCDVHPLTMKDTLVVVSSPPTIFTFRLDQSQENGCAGTGSAAAGWCLAILSGDHTKLSFYLEHNVAGANGAHVHLGAPCVDGAIQFAFSSAASPISETWNLTPTDVTNLMAGNLYVNIHSPGFPNGEIRGQIVQTPQRIIFTLNEAEANAGAGTGSFAGGFAVGTLNAAGTQFAMKVTHDVAGPTDAHVHLGDPGVEGVVQFGFASPVSPINETWSLDTLNIKDLMGGHLYINVHSAAFPGGEIRGQIIRQAVTFTALMDAAQANGGLGTSSLSSGFCTAQLSADEKQLVLYGEHDVAAANAAHVHLGARGVEGTVQYGFSSATSPLTGTWNLSSTDVDNLLAGLLYVNVHSPSFPGGEIRGQFDVNPSYNVPLDQSQENACAGTGSAATGTAVANIKPGGREMTISITHTVSSPIGGHIHFAPKCTDGIVQFSFSSATSPINQIWYLSSTDLMHLLQKKLYTNIHSTPFPNGEIRGQLVTPYFICGDANHDLKVNVGDAVYMINYVFKGGAKPNPPKAGDANCDFKLNVGDAVYLINYVFKSGAKPCNACP